MKAGTPLNISTLIVCLQFIQQRRQHSLAHTVVSNTHFLDFQWGGGHFTGSAWEKVILVPAVPLLSVACLSCQWPWLQHHSLLLCPIFRRLSCFQESIFNQELHLSETRSVFWEQSIWIPVLQAPESLTLFTLVAYVQKGNI